MSNAKQFLAVDLGAESGRVMRGSLAGGRLQIAEAHRFANGPLQQGESLRWDFAKILAGVKRGIALGVEQGGKEIAGISVDSWGVDFGLLDERGELVENPYHYRDRQTEGMLEEAFRRVPKREVYERTGIEIRRINSLFQLLAMRLRKDPALARARRLMFMADLVAHALCGEIFAEYTLASTSQMADMHTGEWSAELLARLDLPAELLPQIVKPGTVVGRLTAAVAAECGCGRVPVIASGSHDTGCAVAAVPAEGTDWAYLSSGTWSLAGVELKQAVITDASFEDNITNEGGVEGTIRFLTSLAGLWLVQECRRQWQREGSDFSYAQLTDMARAARPFAARIEPNDDCFTAPGDMPARINRYLEQNGQRPLSDKGEIVRSILEVAGFHVPADAGQGRGDDGPEKPRAAHRGRRRAECAAQPVRGRRDGARGDRRPDRGDLDRQRADAGESRRRDRLAGGTPRRRARLVPDAALCPRRGRGVGNRATGAMISGPSSAAARRGPGFSPSPAGRTCSGPSRGPGKGSGFP